MRSYDFVIRVDSSSAPRHRDGQCRILGPDRRIEHDPVDERARLFEDPTTHEVDRECSPHAAPRATHGHRIAGRPAHRVDGQRVRNRDGRLLESDRADLATVRR